MVNHFGIFDQDWQQSPGSVQKAFSTLQHQLLLLEIRSQSHERQLTELRQQVSNIDDLKAELDELREWLGQNSNNAS
jgi:cell shape-determining protein MreC